VLVSFIQSYGLAVQLCSSSRCLSKLSFKRVRKATGAFRRLGQLVSPRRKEELGQKFKSQGLFDFKEQTAQVCLHPSPLSIPLSLTPTRLVL
jgi:hypothetical protein